MSAKASRVLVILISHGSLSDAGKKTSIAPFASALQVGT
jgi:hypothetical protein